MRKYFTSHIDFSEIINITTEPEQLGKARRLLSELNILNAKDAPAVREINKETAVLAKPFLQKLHRRMIDRRGGITLVRDTLKMLYKRKDYYGCYFYIAFLYGYLEWQVPNKLVLMPAVPEVLQCYCTAIIRQFDKYIEKNVQTESEDAAPDGKQTNL